MNPANRTVTDEQVKQMIKLKKKGETLKQIAELTGVKMHTVSYWLYKDQHGTHPKKAAKDILKAVYKKPYKVKQKKVEPTPQTEPTMFAFVGPVDQVVAACKRLYS